MGHLLAFQRRHPQLVDVAGEGVVVGVLHLHLTIVTVLIICFSKTSAFSVGFIALRRTIMTHRYAASPIHLSICTPKASHAV